MAAQRIRIRHITERNDQSVGPIHRLAWVAVLFCLPLAAGAQDDDSDEESEQSAQLEPLAVTGTRVTIQNSIDEKRNSVEIVEVLSADDIGDIPALSIGEALETLTSAASHREQGGATEISIRGLGPYLGSTVINGREATNGSGDRSVNFSQFPSELFNKIQIYKTQEASLIEGGVSGQISLETLKPLDYGKQRIQVDTKLNYNPDNNDININERDYGYRGTASYVDQFATGAGDIGVSFGLQRNVATNPEQEYRSSSTYRDCRNDPNVSGGVYASGNCDSGSGNLNTTVDPITGLSPDDASTPFIFVPSSRSYRQNITDDERDSVFAAVQWRPNARWDVNLDLQYSDRDFSEVRNDLVFAEHRRVNPDGLVVGDNGAVLAFSNEGRIETNSQFQERLEEYEGAGLNVGFQFNDRLYINFDHAYSNTTRQENIYQVRLQSEPTDIFGNPTPAGTDRPDASYLLPGSGTSSDVMLVTLTNFDVTNPDLFADNARARIDLNQARENEINASRLDFEFDSDFDGITSIEWGIRHSDLEFTSFPRVRDQRTFSDDSIAAVSQACRNDRFPESGFLSEPLNGNTLITNVDEDGNVIAAGTGNAFATFDALCLINGFIGEIPGVPSPTQTVNNVDVEETTLAGYIQANFDTEMFGLPARGNFGVRVVNTDVRSKGLRTTFTTETNDDGTISVIEDADNFTSVTGGDDYTEILPSANIVFDLRDDVLLRGGIYRGLSRPDPADLGFGRDLNVDDGDDPMSLADLVGSANAPGNPDLEPLLSWNYDAAIEWYPNEDTILAFGAYYKRFQGGFENVQQVEVFQIDGQPFPADVTTTRTDSDESRIYGFELTAAHSFSYLPGAWSGLGAKLSYNYADSDFEFEDSTFGESLVVDEAGNVVSERVGLVPPANLFGFSKNVMSAQIYYQIADLDVQVIYKTRSEYFQQFISTPGVIRLIDDTDVWEARVTYQLTDNVSLRLEGINLFDDPKTQFIPTTDNVSEVNSYGPRFFAGVRMKF